jgi:hypothetical protein
LIGTLVPSAWLYDADSGYKANERPIRFHLDVDVYEIASIEGRWHDPDAEYFKVRTTDGKVVLLRYNEQADEWTLQSGFDGDALLARPSIELVTVGAEVIHASEKLIASCEWCHSQDAEIPFDWILAEVTGKHGPFEFMMTETARCPNCRREMTEKTLIERK